MLAPLLIAVYRVFHQFATDQSTVLIMLERVTEAQRMAVRELKEQQASDPRNNKRKRGGGGNDGEDGDNRDSQEFHESHGGAGDRSDRGGSGGHKKNKNKSRR